MKFVNKFRIYLFFPFILLTRLEGFLNRQLLNDKIFLFLFFLMTKGRILNLKNPRRFSEKIQWLKLNNRQHIQSLLADKIEVKQLVAKIIGNKYLNPNIKIFNHPNEITSEDLLPNTVLKCNHDSGSTIIINDSLDSNSFKNVIKSITKSYRKNPYYISREFSYRDICKRILLEKLIPEKPFDYKVHVFNGTCRLIQVDIDRFSKHTRNFYDIDWQFIPLKIQYPNSTSIIARPVELNKMINLSEKLSFGFVYLRVDWYIYQDKLKFGEITFYPGSGQENIYPDIYEDIMGDYIDLKVIQDQIDRD